MAAQQEHIFLEHLNRHQAILYKVCKMYTDDREDQEDLKQEMVYQLWRSYPSFKEQSQFSTWMYRVALNTAILHLKKSKRTVPTTDMTGHIQIADDTKNAEEKERMALFYRGVRTLSKVEKAVIFLYMEGQSHREIAEQMGWSEGNARVRLLRAKNKLKENIKKLEK